MINNLKTIADIEKLPANITYAGRTELPRGKGRVWEADHWKIELFGPDGYHVFDYFTGLGLRKNHSPVSPKLADVLNTLLSDADAFDLQFSEWCDTFGYSDDSISALRTYEACVETGKALTRILGKPVITKMREILFAEDYHN